MIFPSRVLTIPRPSRPQRPTLSPDESRLAMGTRSVADLIAPGAVEVTRDHVRLEHQYVRTLTVTGYPRSVGAGWLAPLLEFEEPIEVSLHVVPMESGQMVSTLSRKLVQLQSSRLFADRSGRLADPEREVAYEDVERLRDALQRGQERIFSVSLYLLLRSGSRAELDALTHRVERTLAGMLAHSRVAYLEQDAGLRSCLPQGQDHMLVYRNMDTSSLATMFPFSASSLTMEHGVFYGIAAHSRTPVLVDPFDDQLENANLVLFATSGAGKSYFTKLLLLRTLVQGVEAIIIDPEDEYRALCTAVDGQYVRLASFSTQQINPFDLPPGDASDGEGRDPLSEQIVAVLALLELMLADPRHPLSPDERALLDATIYQTYAKAGITRDQGTHERPAPLLRDLHALLAASDEPLARGLAPRLGRYVHGSLGGLFSGPTNLSLDRRCVVFNIQALEPELRPLGIHLITAFVWRHIRRSRRPRLLVIDEAWSLLQFPEGGAFLAAMARRARKYYLGLVTITQDVADFLGTEHGSTVLGNAACKLLLKQSSTTIGPVAEAFGLSAEERHALLGASKGEGLFFACGSRMALRIEASGTEHEIATTSPRDLAAREGPAREGPGHAADTQERIDQ